MSKEEYGFEKEYGQEMEDASAMNPEEMDALDRLDKTIDAMAQMQKAEQEVTSPIDDGSEDEMIDDTLIIEKHDAIDHVEDDVYDDIYATNGIGEVAHSVTTEDYLEPEQEMKTNKNAGRRKADNGFNTARDRFERVEGLRQDRQRSKEEEYDETMRWNMLQTHRTQHAILRGKLISVEDTQTEDGVSARIEYAGFGVLIPASQMFLNEPIANAESIPREELVRRRRQILLKLLGAELEFVIVVAQTAWEDNEPKRIVIGSRKQALSRQRKFYFKKNALGDRRINVGDLIREVPIVAVGRESVRVAIGGVETSIHKSNLSHKYLDNISAEFKTGMKIDLVVTKIEELDPEDSSNVRLVANHKMTKMPYYRESVKNCKVGSYYKAQITYINGLQIRMFLTDINAPAFSKVLRLWDTSDLPKPGDEVVFLANSIDTERGVVIGAITRTL